MKYNDLINELFDLLDKNEDIIHLRMLKEKLLKNEDLLKDLENYKKVKMVDLKKKLYTYDDYLEYLKRENRVHFLMQGIKAKFIVFNSRKCSHENN